MIPSWISIHCKHHQDFTAPESLVGDDDDDEATKREIFFWRGKLSQNSQFSSPPNGWSYSIHTRQCEQFFPWLQCSLRMTGETQLHTFWWVWEAGSTAAVWLDDVGDGISNKSWKKVATLGRVRDCHFHCACQASLLQCKFQQQTISSAGKSKSIRCRRCN